LFRILQKASRQDFKSERNYCATKKELLAVVAFLEYFRPYLLGRQFTIRTDHGALTWFQSFKQSEGKIAHWLQKLQECNFSIVHRSNMLDLNVCSPIELCAPQLADPVIDPILQSKKTEQKPQVSAADNLMYQRLAQLWDQLTVKDGVLYQVFVAKMEGQIIFSLWFLQN